MSKESEESRRGDVSKAFDTEASKHTRGMLVKTGPGAYASPDKAEEILKKRSKNRAIGKHRDKGHEPKLKISGLRKFMFGGAGAYEEKQESDKKREDHLEELEANSRRKKKYENQK